MPSYAKFLKYILANKRKLKDHMTMNLTESWYVLVQNKISSKIKDPESFSTSCIIDDISFHKDLCDPDASINLMSFFVFRKLGLCERKPTRCHYNWWKINYLKAYLKVKRDKKYEFVRCKPISIHIVDQKDMHIIIKEHLGVGLIKKRISPYNNPCFLIRNHSEIKRNKSN